MDRTFELQTKALFVGLGGTGKRTLLHLKRKFLEAGIKTALEPKVNLLCIDFDPSEADLRLNGGRNGRNKRASNDGRQSIHLDLGEFLYLDTREIDNRIRDIDGQYNARYYGDWYPDMEGETIKFGVAKGGAAQWRPLGRVGFFEHADTVHAKLREKLEALMRIHALDEGNIRDDPVVIYIISSISGGTGAGTFLDTAYYLRQIAPEAPIYAMLVLPDVYKQWDQHGRLYKNSYAMLKELNVFINQLHPFKAHYPDDVIIEVGENKKPPVDMVFLFDEQVGETTLANADQLVESIAETMFVDMYASAISDEQVAYLTNLSKSTGKLTFDELSERCIFNAVGSTSIIFPDPKETREYLAQRFAADVLLQSLLDRSVTDVETLLGDDPEERGEGQIDITLNLTRERLPEVQENLQKALPSWRPNEIQRMADAMATELRVNRSDFDVCKQRIDSWKEAFLNLQPFPIAPQMLPNERRAAGAFDTELRQFREQVEKDVERLRSGANGTVEHERVDAAIAAAYKELLDELAKDNRSKLAEAQAQFNDGGHAYQRALNDLGSLIAAKPWANFMDLTQRSFTSVLRRMFANGFAPIYDTIGKHIRINLRLTQVIQNALNKHIETDRRDLLEARGELGKVQDELERTASEAHERLVARVRDSRLTEAHVTDEEYMDVIWETVAEKIKPKTPKEKESLLEELERFALKRNIKNLASHPNKSEVEACFIAFALEQIDRLIDEGELDPLRVLLDRRKVDELAALLRKAQNVHFINNDVANNNEVRDVFVSVPVFSRHSDRGGFLTERLRELLDHVFGSPKIHDVYVPGDNRLIVKFVSLNHPTYNLRSIDRLYRQYHQDHAFRKMFHSHGSFADALPEVFTVEQAETSLAHKVYCGNPGCNYDLRSKSRSHILCPECKRPIRSRCGNEGCTADDLNDAEQWPTIAKSPPVKKCPACNGDLLTRWWPCDRHNDHFRTDALNCPWCIAEYRRSVINDDGTFPFDRVTSVRGIAKTYACPGCLSEGRDFPTRFRFIDVYYDVEPKNVEKAEAVLEAEHKHSDSGGRIVGGTCNQCYATLLPLCPHQTHEERRKRPHFVSRDADGFFICTHNQDHAGREIYECGICGFPLEPTATHCPRCKSDLDPENTDDEGRMLRPSPATPTKDDPLYPEWRAAQKYRARLSRRPPTSAETAAATDGTVATRAEASSDEQSVLGGVEEALERIARRFGLEDENGNPQSG